LQKRGEIFRLTILFVDPLVDPSTDPVNRPVRCRAHEHQATTQTILPNQRLRHNQFKLCPHLQQVSFGSALTAVAS
jgi:hypothetical protein